MKNKEVEYFKKVDDRLYFSIPTNDKQRKTFLGLDGTGFWYLMIGLVPMLILLMIYAVKVINNELVLDNKVHFLIVFAFTFYFAILWTLCSHDSNTGKQTFSVLYQIVRYRIFQKKMVRPKYANRKSTIVILGVENDEINEKENNK